MPPRTICRDCHVVKTKIGSNMPSVVYSSRHTIQAHPPQEQLQGVCYFSLQTDYVTCFATSEYNTRNHLLGEAWLLLFFYSCNFTCLEATELAEISEAYSCIRKLGAGVVAISTDSVYSHQAFAETSPRACKFPFPLVSDRNGKISRAYGVWKYETATADRAVFIIDPQGTIKYYSVYPEEVDRNIEEIIRVLHCLQYD